MDHKEFSAKGGRNKWKGVSKKERTKIMSKVRAQALLKKKTKV